MSDRLLITARDPAALAASVEAAAGRSLSWVGPDDPAATEAAVWLASSAPPAVPYRLPRLRWIHSGWAGVDLWQNRPEWNGEVVLTRTEADFPERIAGYVVLQLLADALDLPRALAQQEARLWSRWRPGSLGGVAMLIVGYGAIGRAVGSAATALGMRVWGVRRGPVAAVERESGIHGAEELESLLPRARVVVNLLPLTPQTESFWSARRFSLLAPGTTFVNVSRGRCVDEAALLAGLDAGRPARAVLDVFREEPLPVDHPFWTHPRVRVTPHVAGIGTEESEGRDFAENWIRWNEGKPLLRVVDRERGY